MNFKEVSCLVSQGKRNSCVHSLCTCFHVHTRAPAYLHLAPTTCSMSEPITWKPSGLQVPEVQSCYTQFFHGYSRPGRRKRSKSIFPWGKSWHLGSTMSPVTRESTQDSRLCCTQNFFFLFPVHRRRWLFISQKLTAMGKKCHRTRENL